MKLSELLLELGNDWYPFEVTGETDEYLEVSTGNGLVVYFSQGLGDSGKVDLLFIEFAVNGDYHITGKGNAITVLSTVKKIIETYLPKMVTRSIRFVQFAADKSEPSRIKLYQRAVPIITRILGYGWEPVDMQNSESSLHTFVWGRKSLKETDQMDLFGDNKVYYIMINGVFWMDRARPKKFIGRAEAERVVQRLIDKYGKPAQVVDPDRYPAKYD